MTELQCETDGVTMRGLRSVASLVVRRRLFSSQASVGVVPCDLEDISVPKLSWSELCWSNLARFSRNSALVDGLTGRSYSLAEARELAGRVGSGLLRSGAEPGQVVAALLPNMPEYPILFMAASEAGLVLTTLNPVYTTGEIRGQLLNSETKLIVTSEELEAKVKEAIAGTDIKIITINNSRDSFLQLRPFEAHGDLVSR